MNGLTSTHPLPCMAALILALNTKPLCVHVCRGLESAAVVVVHGWVGEDEWNLTLSLLLLSVVLQRPGLPGMVSKHFRGGGGGLPTTTASQLNWQESSGGACRGGERFFFYSPPPPSLPVE